MKELQLTYSAGPDSKVPSSFRKLKCQPYTIRVPREKGFEQSKRRVLVVVGKVPTDDLRAEALLSSDTSKITMGNILKEADKWARKFGEVDNNKFAFVNFNFFKNYHLGNEARQASVAVKVKRIHNYIDKLKPHLVIVFGDEAACALLPGVEYVPNKRGWVHKTKTKAGHKFNLVSTIDYDDLCPSGSNSGGRDQVDQSNLIGYAFRNIANGLLGKMPVSLASIKPNPIYVDTMGKFKKLYRKLMKAKVIAVDTETDNLNVVKNRLLTIQFAFCATKAYFLPVDHKDGPFTGVQLKFIKKRLAKWLAKEVPAICRMKDPQYIIAQNGGYDLRIMREFLKVPYVAWPLWDATAGEFVLDENIDGLSSYNTRPWGLAQLFCSYGNDWYFNAAFSKSDRKTIKDVKLDKNVLNYGAMDVQSIYGIHRAQQVIASMMDFNGKSYLPVYRRFILVQMSNMIHQMSNMVHRGNLIDKKHLIHIASKQGPLAKLIDEVEKELYSMPSVKKANKILAKQDSRPKTGLFGAVKEPWIFNLSTVDHAQLLFIKVLGLEGVDGETGEDGERVSLDKYFQELHEDVPEVGLLKRKNKIAILRNTFAKGILNRMGESEDAKLDGRLRPEYGYTGVVTGRSNSSKPSLQQIPQHSKEAKIVKRLFITRRRQLHLKLDYSAHEVRGWGFISSDANLAATFKKIAKVIKELRQKKVLTEEDKKRLKTEGDIHRINYAMFSGKNVADVTDEERQAAKAIVFGAIYGMSAKSMAAKLGITQDEAQKLIDKFFAKAHKAASWLEYVVEFANKHFYVYSPLGRRRNLYALLTRDRRLAAAVARRAQNSPIQGMASDFGYNAGRLIESAIHKVFTDLGFSKKLGISMHPAGVNQMVHDSINTEVDFEHALVTLWVLEYCAVYGLRNLIEKVFKFELNADFAIEFEIGGLGDSMQKWDWNRKSLKNLIKQALITQNEQLGHDLNVKKELKLIYREGKKHKAYLEKNFPLPETPF